METQNSNQLLDDNAQRIFLERYAKNGETSWGQLAKRVSSYVIQDDDQLRDKAEKLILQRDFLPNSPCLMNAGTLLAQLSACFVVPIKEDSMKGIFSAIGDMAEIQKCGGGTGFNFSVLREKNSEVSTTKGKASGIVSFMKVFNASSRAVEQGGIRRGANMGIVDTDHPDFTDTIRYKAQTNRKIEQIKKLIADVDTDGELRKILEDRKELTYFNISAGASNIFMQKVIDFVEKGLDSTWDFISRKTGQVHSSINISDLWAIIVQNAWSSGDPGVVFLDLINEYNPIPSKPMTSTNPCGEQPLADYESCNLASINILNHLLFITKDNKILSKMIDVEKLKETVRTIVNFLDHVITVNYYPLPEIKECTEANRKIGLGVMGIADTLYALGIRYGSKDAIKFCEDLMQLINDTAKSESMRLGKEKGNFPNWEISIYAEDNIPMRNATRTTIAPTGSISILAGCSSGIEPNFSLGYYRTVRETHGDGEYKIRIVNPVLVDQLKYRGIYSEELIDKILNNFGSLDGLDEIPDDMKEIFITAFHVTVDEHLAMQQAFQKHCDNAVSKTINMPSSATVSDVSQTYIKAFKMGLKGVTIYRDGSLDSQVLNNVVGEKSADEITFTPVRPRPAITDSYTVKLHSGCCDMNATVGFDEQGDLFEVRISNAGAGCSSMYAGLGMMTSEAIRLGGDPNRIAQQLRQVVCPACTNREGLHGKSCPDLLGKLIEKVTKGRGAVEEFVTHGRIKHVKSETKKLDNGFIKMSVTTKASIYSICPKCGQKKYVMESGCGHCIECGHTNCK